MNEEGYPAALLHIAKAEEALAKLIAERVMMLPDGPEKRFMRSVWKYTTTRANYFWEMAINERD